MLGKYVLRRRLKKLAATQPDDGSVCPAYLLELAECVHMKYLANVSPSSLRHLPVHIIRRRLDKLTHDVKVTLAAIESGGSIPISVLAAPEHITIMPFDDFLTTKEHQPIYLEEVVNDHLVIIKQLLSGINVYREEDSVRHEYYARKLQYLLSDIYVLLETLLLIALR